MQVGDYRAGLRDGYGVYAFPNGDRYAGQSLGDLPHGSGVYIFCFGAGARGLLGSRPQTWLLCLYCWRHRAMGR